MNAIVTRATALAILYLTSWCSAEVKVFTGAFSQEWSNAANWFPVGVPTAADDVLIPVGTTCRPADQSDCRTLLSNGTLLFTSTRDIWFTNWAILSSVSQTFATGGGLVGPNLTIDGFVELDGSGAGVGFGIGPVTVSATGTLHLTNVGHKYIGVELTNYGEINWDGGTISLEGGDLINYGVINASLAEPAAMVGHNGVRRVINHGTINIDGSMTIEKGLSTDTHLENEGQIFCSGLLRAPGIHNGLYEATADGATFEFGVPSSYGDHFELVGPFSLNVLGTLPFPITNAQTVKLGNCTVEGDIDAEKIVFAASPVAAVVNGSVHTKTFAIDGISLSLTCSGGLTISDSGSIGLSTIKAAELVIEEGASVTFSSTFPGGSRRFECDVHNHGSIAWTLRDTLLAGTTLFNHGDLVLDASSFNLHLSGVPFFTGQRLVNTGTITKKGVKEFRTATSNANFPVFTEQLGTFSVDAGMVTLRAGLHTGTLQGLPTGTVKLIGDHFMTSEASIGGEPKVVIDGAALTAEGNIRFGGPLSLVQGGSANVASLSVASSLAIGASSTIDAGSFTMEPGSSISFAVANGGADPAMIAGSVVVERTAHVAGVVALESTASFANCSTVTLITAGRMAGRFDGPVAPTGTAIWTLEQTSATVEATFAEGDLDGSGTLDPDDLAELFRQWGTDGAGDLNCDGVTDGADLTLLLGAIRLGG